MQCRAGMGPSKPGKALEGPAGISREGSKGTSRPHPNFQKIKNRKFA